MKVDGFTIANVYKPPSAEFEDNVFPTIEKPSIVTGDFNSHNTLWGYDNNDSDGVRVADWMTRERYSIVYDANDPGTFRSRRWSQSHTRSLFCVRRFDGTVIPTTRRILKGFPNGQHRSVVINVGLRIPLCRADKKSKWNFSKANWELFTNTIEQTVRRIPPIAQNYNRFANLIKCAAKESIPRGNRDAYIPGKNESNQELYTKFKRTSDVNIGKELLKGLDESRKELWEHKMNSLNFAKSARKAWNFINRLDGKSKVNMKVSPITSDEITAELIEN